MSIIPVIFPIILKKHGITFPYTFTPSSLPDGALPPQWIGSTFVISSGVVVNTPTLGEELLTDPGLEANYTAGLCDTLTKGGSPTVAQSADVHGGSKAQEFTGTAGANFLTHAGGAGVANQWYLASTWGKRTAGATVTTVLSISQTGMLPGTSQGNISDAAYTLKKVAGLSVNTNNISHSVIENGTSNFPTVIFDDSSLKKITQSSLFALLSATQANVVAKVRTPGLYASWADDTYIGVMIRADTQSNPTSFIIGYMKRRPNAATLGVAGIIKKVGATYSSVMADQIVTLAANTDLELRANGSTVQLFYNGSQVSTDKTISDAELIANKHHGYFSAGGNNLGRFYLQAN